MTDLMPAETLSTAAKRLRERATAPNITPGPWLCLDGGDRIIRYPGIDDTDYVVDEPTSNSANAEWIALMHPGVGLALADWLEREAAIWTELEAVKAELHPKGYKLSWPISTHDEALAVARAVLGGAQ
jgi:hypothetical protein